MSFKNWAVKHNPRPHIPVIEAYKRQTPDTLPNGYYKGQRVYYFNTSGEGIPAIVTDARTGNAHYGTTREDTPDMIWFCFESNPRVPYTGNHNNVRLRT